MHKRACVLILVVGLLAPAWGCGSADAPAPAGGARPGPQVFGLPFLPAATGQVVTLGLKNLFAAPAAVFVSAYAPGGAPYHVDGDALAPGLQPVMLTVPGNGELRVPLSTVTGAATGGGWMHVDTRNVYAPDPVTGEPTPLASSGFVFPYLDRAIQGGTGEIECTPGFAGQPTGVGVGVTPATDTIQLVNQSYNQAPGGPVVPLAVTFAVRTFDVAGNDVGTLNLLVPANGTAEFAPGVVAGSIRIEPIGALLPPPPVPPAAQQIRYAATARENGHQVHVEHRAVEADLSHLAAQVEIGFEVEFGADPEGNLHDFEVLMANPTGTAQTIVLQGIYLAGAPPLLTAPRPFSVRAGRTVLMRTQTATSLGLDALEDSLFEDHFGDVFMSSTYRAATLLFQVPATVDVSARHVDPAFGSFYAVLRAVPRTNAACVADLPVQPSTAVGVRDWITITNPTADSVSIPMRGYTPGGTEYILDPLSIGPFERIAWSPDGLVWREDPSDTTGPPVTFMQFRFFPRVGLCFRPHTIRRDAGGLIDFIAPKIVRDN